MVQVTFAIKINPRFERTIIKEQGTASRKASKTFLMNTSKLIKKTMQEEAPMRSGKLRRGIKIAELKTTKSGDVDRRALINVVSTAPHSKYVVGGTLPSPGAYVGPGSTSINYKGTGRTETFRAARNFTGRRKGFRAVDYAGRKVGRHPGFEANDFISRAGQKVFKKINAENQRFLGINAYTESYNKLSRMFG